MKKLILIIIILLGFGILGFGISQAADSGANALDPLYIGVGARPLGMGKAYVAVAEDGDTIFMNPAGLGKINGLKISSMSSSLINDVNYSLVGVASPITFNPDLGSVGIGYVRAGVDDIRVFGNTVNSHNPTPLALGNHASSVLFLSYGNKMSNVAPFGIGDNIYYGANVKYFMKQNGGTALADPSNGTGFDADLAMIAVPQRWLSLGLNAQNILPSSMGGRVIYDSGLSENMPALIKTGVRVSILGAPGDALFVGPDTPIGNNYMNWIIAGDVDINPDTQRPSGYHIGTEFWPIKLLALRAGLDKDPVPSNSNQDLGTNMTLGLGLRAYGFEFDYAYHPYTAYAENNTHYFSISYVGPDEGPIEARIIYPPDRLITYDNSIEVRGYASDKVKEVEINGNSILVPNTGKFTVQLPLYIGKNLIISRAYATDGKMVMEDRKRILRLKSFSDVVEGFWAKEQIEFAATAGLVEGYPDDTFRPNTILSRAELTTLLVRIKGEKIYGIAPGKLFRDLPNSHWAAKYIDTALKTDMVQGYPDGTFKADRRIDRAEGVTVASRFDDLAMEKQTQKPYVDVAKKHWAAPAIEAAKDKGLIDYIQDKKFYPKRGLGRAESVVILTRTDAGSKAIDEMLDWDKGYKIRSTLIMEKQPAQ